MVMTQSRMLALGTLAPPFSLPDPAGKQHALEDFASAKALLVAFICNHCPYVKHMIDGLGQFSRDYRARGVAVVAINANDVSRYPDDSPENMARLVSHKRLDFPYLYDQSQAVARAYRAVCTPDLFLFDQARKLSYRGQFDGSRPGNGKPVTGADLRAAADATLAGREIREQIPSVGCSIKWRPGQEPE
ncbi:MAG: thioredoxin family protein [Steroidobacteraceae bacterium]